MNETTAFECGRKDDENERNATRRVVGRERETRDY